ncbi:MAG: hypothetical protein M1831_002450 [Alyxoria varia]|nr:MAG: hypothetical protein M1831_002450 [Alyxoria varia]
MAAPSVWNPDNIRDCAESLGLAALPSESIDHLTREVEFRIAQVLEESLKFMRHAKRTTLHVTDVSSALKVLDVEPLFGYEATRPLRFGEASIGPGQPLYYLEDEEVDFEKLVNAPLPKVPREVTFTLHWLAIEGVQPTIPQNPAPADQPHNAPHLLPKGPGANTANLAATAGADNLSVKPQVKHVLSSELQLYFKNVCAAVLDENNANYRTAALASLRDDPGLHQLVPYFVHFVSERVTHNLKNLFQLGQMMHIIASLLENQHLHVAPYVASLVAPVLTCLVGKRLGPSSTSSTSTTNGITLNGAGGSSSSDTDSTMGGVPSTSHPNIQNALQQQGYSKLPPHYPLRTLASSVLHSLTQPRFTATTPALNPRLSRALLRHLLSSTPQPLGTYYGAVKGLASVSTGREAVAGLLLPNVRVLEDVFSESLLRVEEDRKAVVEEEIRVIVEAVVEGLGLLGEQGEKEKEGKVVKAESEDDGADAMEGVESAGAAGDEGLLGARGTGVAIQPLTEERRSVLVGKLGDRVAKRLCGVHDKAVQVQGQGRRGSKEKWERVVVEVLI